MNFILPSKSKGEIGVNRRVSSVTNGLHGASSMNRIGTIKVRELYLNQDPSKNLLSKKSSINNQEKAVDSKNTSIDTKNQKGRATKYINRRSMPAKTSGKGGKQIDGDAS